MNIQTKYLQKLRNDQTFTDIYTDRFQESTYCYILDFNEEFILLEKFTNVGKPDGISVIKRENITRIKWSGNDIKTTSKFALKEKRNQDIFNINIDSIYNILNSVEKLFGYVTIYIQDIDTGICIIGEIKEIDGDHIIIEEYGTFTSLDRKMLILSTNEITKIEGGALYENNLHELFGK
ncbi:hypothetical protein [Halpernia sp. GG3]